MFCSWVCSRPSCSSCAAMGGYLGYANFISGRPDSENARASPQCGTSRRSTRCCAPLPSYFGAVLRRRGGDGRGDVDSFALLWLDRGKTKSIHIPCSAASSLAFVIRAFSCWATSAWCPLRLGPTAGGLPRWSAGWFATRTCWRAIRPFYFAFIPPHRKGPPGQRQPEPKGDLMKRPATLLVVQRWLSVASALAGGGAASRRRTCNRRGSLLQRGARNFRQLPELCHNAAFMRFSSHADRPDREADRRQPPHRRQASRCDDHEP